MSNYITDFTFNPKQYGSLTLVDYRLLTSDLKNKLAAILRTAMLTASSQILCGGPETEQIAIGIENERAGGLTADEIDAFLEQYRAEQNTRTTVSQFVGNGIVKFALFNGVNLIGSVHICQASILSRNGNTVNVRITPLVHRTGVRVMNAARTAFTAQFIQDQANFARFALNNSFDVMKSPLVVQPVLIDSHPRNSRFETLQAVINFDASYETIMAGFGEIDSINGTEGSRQYKLFKLNTTVL